MILICVKKWEYILFFIRIANDWQSIGHAVAWFIPLSLYFQFFLFVKKYAVFSNPYCNSKRKISSFKDFLQQGIIIRWIFLYIYIHLLVNICMYAIEKKVNMSIRFCEIAEALKTPALLWIGLHCELKICPESSEHSHFLPICNCNTFLFFLMY